MKAQEIQKKLESMKGKSYEYAKAIHTVKSYEVSNTDQKFVIKTNLNSFTRKFESAPEFFKYWYEQAGLPAAAEEQSQVAYLPVLFEQENSLADELVTLLKGNIEKVKADPKYIPQAKSINNDVNSILLIQRLKLDLVKNMGKKR